MVEERTFSPNLFTAQYDASDPLFKELRVGEIVGKGLLIEKGIDGNKTRVVICYGHRAKKCARCIETECFKANTN